MQLDCGPMNAQRDGRPAEYRWHPLFNAAKFGWRPLPECRAVQRCLDAKPVEISWGAPNYRTDLKFTILWGDLEEVLLLNNFFPIVDTCLSCEDMAR